MSRMERVSVIEGRAPVVFVAPHCEETNTDLVAASAANWVKGFAVVNRGWRKAAKYDYALEQADCNRLDHLVGEVVLEEFLLPLVRYVRRIRKKYPLAIVCTVHGVGDHVRQGREVKVIMGTGRHKPTCDPWLQALLYYRLDERGLQPYLATVQSGYAAAGKENLCQYFRQRALTQEVHSVQLEVIHELRGDPLSAVRLGQILGTIMEEAASCCGTLPFLFPPVFREL